MTVEAMRDYICKMYNDSPKWRLKVLAMPDRQVIAIYKNMKTRGQTPNKPRKDIPRQQQITIFDLLGGLQNG